MSDIRKPNFAKSVQQPLREFSVPDAGDFEEMQDELPHPEPIVKKQSLLSESVRKRIDFICGFARETRDVKIGDVVFVLRTLKSKEVKDVITGLSNHDGTLNFPFETRKRFLAKSLCKVSGTDISVFLGSNSEAAVLEFIDELEESMVSKLYSEYQALSELVNSKYLPQDDNSIKEVSEEVKK